MSNPIILELKESKSKTDTAIAGTYTTTLDEPLMLSDGDTVAIRNVFIDTVDAASGKILVTPDDQNLEMDVVKYMVDLTDGDTGRENITSTPPQAYPCGQPYIPCKDSFSSLTGNCKRLLTIEVFPVKWSEVKGTSWGTGGSGDAHDAFKPVTMSYTNQDGKATPFNLPPFRLPIGDDGGTPHTISVDSLNLIFKSDGSGINSTGFTLVTPDADHLAKYAGDTNKDVFYNIDIGKMKVTFDDESNSGVLLPVVDTFKMKIPLPVVNGVTVPKAYDPAELCQIITDEMARINIHFDGLGVYDAGIEPDPLTTSVMSSPFLTSTKQLIAEAGRSLDPTLGTDLYLCRADAADVIRYNTTSATDKDVMIGAAEVALVYDQQVGKAAFSFLHSFIYVPIDPSAHPVQYSTGVQYIKRNQNSGNNAVGAGDYFVANKAGGVGFFRMTPHDFWFQKLGMDPNILLPYSQVKHPAGLAGLSDYRLPVIPFEEGVNTTGQYRGVAGAVDAGADFRFRPNIDGRTVVSTVVSTPLYGATTINGFDKQKPYFMIEIAGIGSQDLRGEALKSNRVQAIVSRFYVADSFTTAYNEGSVAYTHKGAPQMLSGFSVRILGPDLEPATDIDHDSTVFVEIIRAGG